jgi:N-acetylglucosamine-6-phosphate deacetylase
MVHGCNLITHLYSCTSTVTRDHGFRRPGVIETAWLEDDLYVEIIADGKHLPAQLLKLICKIKGSDRIILCTDSMQVAGCNMTRGHLQDIEFIIEDGVCKLPDRSAFAGSIATADRLVRVMVQEAGVSVPKAVKMLTEVPARVMNLDTKGKLAQGCDADIVIFDDDIQIKQIFVSGSQISLS